MSNKLNQVGELRRIKDYFEEQNEKIISEQKKIEPKRVLYLEDSTIDIIVFERMVESDEITVDSFLTMKDLKRDLEAKGPRRWDLLVVDYNSVFYSKIIQVKQITNCNNILVTSGTTTRESKFQYFPFVEKDSLAATVKELISF